MFGHDMLAHRPLVVAHMCDFPLVHLPTGGVVGPLSIWTLNIEHRLSRWWFQPIWKVLVKLDHFPR